MANGQQEFSSKDIIPKGLYHRLFLLLTILEVVFVVIVTSISLKDSVDSENTSDSYLAGIILLSSVFFCYFAFHGIYRSNKFEIYAVLLALVLVEAYVIYRFAIRAGEDNLDAIQYLSIIIITLLSIAFGFVTFKLFRSFDEWRFRKLDAALQQNQRLRECYMWYEAWVTLMKSDIQFGIIFVLMGLFFFLSTAEIFINMIAIFATFVWAFVGHIGVRMEDLKYMFVFYVFSPLFPANIIWKLYALTNEEHIDLPLTQIVFAGVIALILRTLLLAVTVKMQLNFGNNLRDLVFDPEAEEEPTFSIIAEQQVRPYVTATMNKISSMSSFYKNSGHEASSHPQPQQHP